MSKVSVLFVCMGNICRSPTAHGVFEHMVEQTSNKHDFFIDSAGTHSHHNGEIPDSRSIDKAKQRGYDLSYIRSRRIVTKDFEVFDYIIAMDSDNMHDLHRKCPPQYVHKLHLFMELSGIAQTRGHVDVPDPYYGGQKGFSYVLELVEEGSQNILDIMNKEVG